MPKEQLPDLMPEGVTLRDWEDHDTLRQSIFDSTKRALADQFPLSYGGVRLELHDLDYDSPKPFDLNEQKEALMSDKYLTHRLTGTYRLFDEKTGALLGEQKATVAKVPYLTDRGTFIHGGSEYAVINQARLQPGIYHRRKESGELEAHVNAKRMTGSSFRIRLEPDTGLYKLDIGQSSLRLYSLLKDMGVPDEELEKRWGKDVLGIQQAGYDRRVFDKAYARLVRKPDPNATREQKIDAIKKALGTTKLDRRVTEKNLSNLFHDKVAAEFRKQASQAQAGGWGQSGAIAGPSSPQDLENPTHPDPAMIREDEDTASDGVSKEDVLAIAMFLNKEMAAGIPLDQSLGKLTDDIREVIDAKMPGLMPEVVEALQAKKPKVAKVVRTKEELDRAAHRAATSPKNKLPLPTKPQQHAGNYRKGKLRLHGLDISIENPKGSVRSGTDKLGKKWSVKMQAHYGQILGHVGADGDLMDVFIGPDLETDSVWVVNQVCPFTGLFDEHKCLMGFSTEQEARDGYLANYAPGWRGLGSIVRFDLHDFRRKLPKFDKTKPIKK